jgi:hypothetical protein
VAGVTRAAKLDTVTDLLAEYDKAIEVLDAAREAHDAAYKEADRIYRALPQEQRDIVNQRYSREVQNAGKEA